MVESGVLQGALAFTRLGNPDSWALQRSLAVTHHPPKERAEIHVDDRMFFLSNVGFFPHGILLLRFNSCFREMKYFPPWQIKEILYTQNPQNH